MQDNPPNDLSPFLRLTLQALFVFFAGLFVFLFLWFASIIVDQVWHAGRILPGISMNRIDLSGLEIDQAAQMLESGMMFGENDELTLQYADISWQAHPFQIGLQFNANASARKAFEYGRKGPLGSFLAYQFLGRHSSYELQPIVTLDEKTAWDYLSMVSNEFDLPMEEAGLTLNGTQVIAQSGQIGRTLDIPASINLIADQMRKADISTIQLVIEERRPEIIDASAFASQAQVILSRSFEFAIPDGQSDVGRTFNITPEKIAPMLTFTRQINNSQAVLIPQFREDLLLAYLVDIADRTAIRPQNPRFIFNDDTRQLDLLTSAVTGRELNTNESIQSIQSAIAANQSSALLVFNSLTPEITDSASAAELGITELLVEESSYFYGSSEPRIQNIEKAASEFHGLLVPPGATFSMAASMGDVSLDNGYTEALIIFNGRTIEGVGGGVCQVSTTLFRTAFFSGFPIVERYPHAYRVSYYEKTSGNGRDADLAGLDATVYVPLVDLKFTNDTLYWLLMETYVNRGANRITWKFYSTSDSRSVEMVTTGPVNIVEPKKPLYTVNSKLSAGEIKQVDWEADGADVRVERYVYRDGALIASDTFLTHYAPWRAVYECGPGTDCPISKEEDE